MDSKMASSRAPIRTLRRQPEGYLDLELEASAISALARPGQFVMLRVNASSDPLLPRPFDIVEVFPERLSFRLIVKVVGKATALLNALHEGDCLEVTGPFGAPVTDFACASLALLVRGCGAAAVLMFLQEARRRKIRVHTVLSASTASKFILKNEIESLSDSLHLATDNGSAGEKALGSDVLRKLLARQPVDRVYSCGGGPFYLPALSSLEASGRPVYLFLESYMACGFGYCHGCAVKKRGGGYALVCQDGPLFRLNEVEDPCLIYQ